MRIKKKILGVALALGMVFGSVQMVPRAAQDDEEIFERIGTTETITRADAVVKAAKSFADGGHTKKSDIPYVDSLNTEWCARFAAYCVGDKEVVDNAGIANSSTATMNYYIRKERYHDVRPSKSKGDKYIPKRGDLVFFSWDDNSNDAEHVGIVVNAGKDSSSRGYWIETVEGNYGSSKVGYKKSVVQQVDRRYVAYDGIIGFATPYDENDTIDYVCGDFDNDGKVDQTDATFILKMCMWKFEIIPENVKNEEVYLYFSRADVSGNERLDQIDSTYILRWIMRNDLK